MKYTVVGIPDGDFACPLIFHVIAGSEDDAIEAVQRSAYAPDIAVTFNGHIRPVSPADACLIRIDEEGNVSECAGTAELEDED